MQFSIKPQGIWFHGSNKIFDILEEGSTITQWRKLAEAFSHKPIILAIDDDNSIIHNGKACGYLYMLDESVDIDIDIYAHPRTTMDKGLEFLTKRKIKVKMIMDVGVPNEEYQKSSEEKIKEWLNSQIK
jgi:hypothetical protein